MTMLSGYVLEPVRQEGDVVLYRARRDDADQSRMLVVAPLVQPCGPATLRRLEHEYAVRSELDPAWAARPLALSHSDGGTILLLEDYGGEPLARLLYAPLELRPFLRMAIEIASALGHVHAKGLIHKDVKPANILVHAVSGRVWLTGFGIASELPRERQAPDPPQAIAGTLAYMAPEQTGRMNRSIDSRSDLYSLGVTFYEMLTGELPFVAGDPMEWVHCHIARLPAPPAERVPGIPAPVSAIVMKLLAKNPEERYQSARGVAADLRRCLTALDGQRRIDPFPLGAQDVPDRLMIPEKLYGRDRETRLLLAAFARVAAGGTPELVLVSGYSGIGKSSLVNELHRVIVPPRGLFASGKFDQLKRDIPYATLAQAFHSLVRQMLSRGEAELDSWRNEVRAALGGHGRLIVDLVPEIEVVIGSQPALPELAPNEAENRFHAVLGRFLAVFARRHPCVLFLDDLQWLDTATLKFLDYAMTRPESGHLLLIGAYRDNEVGPTHPLMRALESMRGAGTSIQTLVLTPLPVEDVGKLVAASLHCPRASAVPLAQLVHDKTAGNPFFAIQFLTALNEQNLLVFDARRGAWTWDIERIRHQDITENVVGLMLAKLRRLPAASQEALGQFACLGISAETADLRTVLGCDDVDAALHEAARAGFVQRMDGTWRFAHDRIREASYALIPQDERPAAHLRIGRLLSAGLSRDSSAERIFEAANQLNAGSALISAPGERLQLCVLNVRAGRRARRSGAYASALGYFVRATDMLPAGAWSLGYDQTFGLYLYRTQCEYLVGNFAQADELFALILANARSDVDRAKAYRLRIQLYQISGRHADAVAAAFAGLELFGMRFPASRDDIGAATDAEQQSATVNLAGRSVAELYDAPLVSDPTIAAIICLLADSFTSVYTAHASLLPLVVLRALNLCLRHGNIEESCGVYSCYGFVVLSLYGEIRLGAEFSDMSVRLSQKFTHPKTKGRLLVVQAAFIDPWRAHIASSLPLLEQAFLAALDIGDLVYAGYTACFAVWLTLEAGGPLDETVEVARRYGAFARQTHNEPVSETVRLSEQYAASLKGATQQPGSFSDADFDEAASLRLLETAGAGVPITAYHIQKLAAACMFGRYAEAQEHASRAAVRLHEVMATVLESMFYVYHALTLAACHADAPADRQRELAAALEQDLRKIELWARHCPENFHGRHALVAAEMARIEGRVLEAMELYEQAIRSARTSGFLHVEALANELAARFHLARGLETMAQAYLREAKSCYRRWGALGKVGQLESQYPQLAESPSLPSAIAAGAAAVAHIDAMAVVKASQAVSSEIVLERLLETLMRIVIANAGAQRACLLLGSGEALALAAEAGVDGQTVSVHLPGGKVPPSNDLPESILNYVRRSRQKVILADASAPHPFASDAWFSRRRAGSVLCMPILHQAELVGLLYLDNRLVTSAFTPERVAVLELLAAQAVISLQNARLYSDLQRENSERKRAEAERREAEERLRQSQKMQAVGQLTGGIAHDFNNMLTVIIGTSEVLADGVADRPQLAALARVIDEAATRGATLTRQLLAFARKQPLSPRRTDLNALVVDTARLLQPTLGEQVEIESMLDDSAWPVTVDPTQLSTALINLAVNARDAMPRGGKLRFETANVTLDAAQLQADPEVQAGPYVMIAVSDSGTGIPPDLLDKIFEPFFTTKDVGKGTGLGLSMVYGFVKQSGGHVGVQSEEGKGTTIRLYLPRSADAGDLADPAAPKALQGGGETILVVEDDPLTRKFVLSQLESLGYTAVPAATGTEALALVDQGLAFDLLFTDLILPDGLNGRQLAEAVARRRPSLRVLYTSGYAEQVIMQHGPLGPGLALLSKPYRKAELARRVREALGRAG
jgi:predicted ATPase/signal transduction histidine kinase